VHLLEPGSGKFLHPHGVFLGFCYDHLLLTAKRPEGDAIGDVHRRGVLQSSLCGGILGPGFWFPMSKDVTRRKSTVGRWIILPPPTAPS
jgi:hypothetical protein